MAGALKVRLEKIGHYSLGDEIIAKEPAHIRHAIKLVKLTTLLFIAFVSLPIILVMSLLSI